MSVLTEILNAASGFIWGPIMLVLLLGTGVFLTIGLKAMPWRHLIAGFQLLWSGRRSTARIPPPHPPSFEFFHAPP